MFLTLESRDGFFNIMVTLKDIAEKTGYHFTTISKALNDHPRISPKTKAKILAIAKEMDYHPNTIAQSFKRQRSKTIGVIVPQIRNDFFSSVISGIEAIIYEAGYTLMISQSNESFKREALHIKTFVSNQVAGVLIAISKETDSVDHFATLKRHGIGLVMFDRILENNQLNSVTVNDYDGAFEIVTHLIKSGYRKIAHLAGPQRLSVVKNRLQGYIDALKNNNIAPDERLIIHDGLDEQHGENGMKQLMNAKIKLDAVFCVNDLAALGTYRVIKSFGLCIPKDVAVAGFGNNIISSYLDPPLTTVNQSPFLIGKIAAKMILRQISKNSIDYGMEKKIVHTKLIVRKST